MNSQAPGLVNLDLSAIEARILASTTQDQSHHDLYTNIAADILGCDPKDVTPTGRQVGKQAALLALYQPHTTVPTAPNTPEA